MKQQVSVRSGLVAEGREPLVCVPLVASSVDALDAELALAVTKRPDLIEWRADFFAELSDTRRVLDVASRLRAAAHGIPILFTVRSAQEGGQSAKLTDEQVTTLCVAVAEAGSVELLDCEKRVAATRIERIRRAATQSSTTLILSYHNFNETPDHTALVAHFAQAQALGADIAKVAVMPSGPQDVLTLLGASLQARTALGIPLIAISMGRYGVLSRLAGALFGSAITFAVAQRASAAGQLPIDELRTALAIVERGVPGGA